MKFEQYREHVTTVSFSREEYSEFSSIVSLALPAFRKKLEKSILWPKSFSDMNGELVTHYVSQERRTHEGNVTESDLKADDMAINLTLPIEAWGTCYQIVVMSVYGAVITNEDFFLTFGYHRATSTQLLENFHTIFREITRRVRMASKRMVEE